jgi:hypothetical protein
MGICQIYAKKKHLNDDNHNNDNNDNDNDKIGKVHDHNNNDKVTYFCCALMRMSIKMLSNF